MLLKPYLFSLPMDHRIAFARRCRTSYGHLRNVAYGQKPCAPELAIRVERESGRAVRCETLCPDVDWAYLRGTAPHVERETA